MFLYDMWFDDDSLDNTWKAQAKTTGKSDFMKKFSISEYTINNVKRPVTEWEKMKYIYKTYIK